MERRIKTYRFLGVIIVLGSFNSALKAENESATTCECAPTWDDHWDRYIPNLSLLTATQRMVFLVDSDVKNTMADTILVAVPPTLVWKFVSKIPNLKPFASNSKFYVEMLEQKYRRLSKQGRSYILNSDIEAELQVAKTIIKEATGGVTNLVSDWNVTEIIAYNALVQKDLLKSASYFKLKQVNKTAYYPQKNLTLFADWYLPIYEQHGGNETIRRFVEVINSRYLNSNNRGLLSDKAVVSPGEFVQSWSQAANTDLRDLAYKAFGWIPEYRRQFESSRKTFSPYNYRDVYPNTSMYKPPQDLINQGRHLSLSISDDHVAFYNDGLVFHNATWPFKIASDAWSYVKAAYNFSGPDPILYLIFQNKETAHYSDYTFSKKNSYINKEYENRLVLDFHTISYKWKWNEVHDFLLQDLIVEGVGKAATAVFKETGNIPFEMLDSGFTEIFTLDIYFATGTREDTNRYFATVSSVDDEDDASGNKKVQLFLAWYYPIYTGYGGIAAFKRFLTSLYELWPRKGTDYTEQMRRGEFVHFWSGATGADLTLSAIKAFGMSPTDLSVLNQAHIDYPMLNYTLEMRETLPKTWEEHWGEHKENLTLDYFDDHVAFYLDPTVNQNITWLTSFISEGWKYARATYGTIGQGPLLYIVLHGSHTEYAGCLVSRSETFADRDFENQNVIDCGLPRYTANTENDALKQVEKLFVTALAHLIKNSAKGVGKWPGVYVSGPSFYTIIAYDILTGIGRTETANIWYTEKLLESEKTKRPNSDVQVFWFQDWYYPIYTQNGGNAALNNFLDILNTHWPQENNDYVKILGWDEWVHFWSAAVGENLLHLAYGIDDWNVGGYKFYLAAREDYPLNYSDVYQNATVVFPPTTWEEELTDQVEDKENLELVYTDANVAIYYDTETDLGITWPFKPLSAAWAHAKRFYGPFSSDPLLYVLFYERGTDVGCVNFKYQSAKDDLYGNKSVISCGQSSNPWKPPERLVEVIREVATVIMLTAKATRYSHTLYDIEQIISYDLYKAIGKSAEASEWLKQAMRTGSEGFHLVRDWYYPIYTKYGGAQVLDNFFTLQTVHFQRIKTSFGYARRLNKGEYVHFWSGATGTNLTDWAKRANLLTTENEIEFQKALLKFPMVTYAHNETVYEELDAVLVTEKELGHTELIFQHYIDSNVNVYFDSDVDVAANWTFSFLSKSWQQTKSSYETVRETASPILKTVLHANQYKGCKTLLKMGKDIVKKITTIDCGSANRDKWSKVSKENKYDLISQYPNLIQECAEQPEDSTPYVRREFSKQISFDLFVAQGMFEEAHGILSKGYNETEIQSGENKFWVRDWFLPIYTTYGGVSVLNKFLTLLPTHWNFRGQNTGTTTMNVGQLVHFWSAAAGESVLNVAQDTFGRGSLLRDKLNEAKKDFSLPLYTCYDCYYDGFEKSTSERNLITGLSFGFTAIVAAIVIISLYLYRKKVSKLQEQIRELTNEEITEFFEGNSNAAGGDGNASIESKPFNKDYEIPRDRLDFCKLAEQIEHHIIQTTIRFESCTTSVKLSAFDNVLGSGEFGVLLRGKIKSTSGSETVVAVKTVKPDVDVTCFKALLIELKVMCYLGIHENIASLLGAFTVNIRSREVYVALELCSKGDLLKFLKNNRSNFTNLFSERKLQGPNNEDPSNPNQALHLANEEESSNYIVTDASSKAKPASFSTLNLLEWSSQVANGMNYIASKKVIHGDLAARNVLLTLDNVAKISDFGLSRQLLNYSNYMKTSKTPVPWRWMAIESLRDMNFSVQSDTWAFGVTLYEIFSLGTTPYAGWTWDYEFIDKLVAGHRLSEPDCGNPEIYTLMMDCMKINPEERISYVQLILRFEDIKQKLGEQPVDGNLSEGE